ncbi:MAG TPA: hypothetical protein VE397_11785, partial [Stellaceae bacterium]|nr:hypothetical protein [Stellaceae bacterium]
MAASGETRNRRSPAPARGFAAFRPAASVRLCPTAFLEGAAAAAALAEDRALPLAGGPLAFTEVEARTREAEGARVACGSVEALRR